MARRRRYNRKRRRGSFAFLYKLLAFVLICGAIGLALAMFFKVEDIEVNGNSRYSKEQIVAAAEVKPGDNLFLLNKYDAAARIRQQLPYVETVQFRRVLPNKLVVQVTECRDPVAIKQDGTVYLLCSKGNIVDTVSAAKWSQYIQIEGLTLLDPQVGGEARASATQQMVLERLLGLESVTLIRCGGSDFIAAQREQWNDGSNTLCIAPGRVVTYDRNYVTNELLDKNGVEVLAIPAGELSRGRGGPRCMSMPLVRGAL